MKSGLPTLLRYLLTLILGVVAGLVTGQEKVGLGLFEASAPLQGEVRINAGYAETGSRYLTNLQFTLKWPVSSGVAAMGALTAGNAYQLQFQGSPLTHGGYYYQRVATAGGMAVKWNAGEENLIFTFSYAAHDCPVFEIAADNFVAEVSVNGVFYMEINGLDCTGVIYQPRMGQEAPGSPGAIGGPQEICIPLSGVVYHVEEAEGAESYVWSYTGEGVTLESSGAEVTLAFGEGATSGSLTVAAENACGPGPASEALDLIVHSPPEVYAGADRSIPYGTSVKIADASVTGSAPFTCLWSPVEYFADSGVLEASTVTMASTVTLTLTVTDGRGCQSADQVVVTVDTLNTIAERKAWKDKGDLVVRPNPTTGKVTLEFPGGGLLNGEVRIFSVAGTEVPRRVWSVGEEEVLDLSGLGPGLYLVRAGNESRWTTGKVLLKRE